MKRIWLILAGLIVAGLLSSAIVLAQTGEPTGGQSAGRDLKRSLVIGADGRLLVDGRVSREASLNVLPDALEVRYKVLDQPGISFNQVTVEITLPPTVEAAAVEAHVYAVHGVADYQLERLSGQTMRLSAIGVGPSASLTVALKLPQSAITLSIWGRWRLALERFSVGQWLAIGSVPLLAVAIMATMLVVRQRRDLFLPPAKPIDQPPSSLPPAMVGLLLYGSITMREIAATLIDLAERGYIDIIYRGPADFAFSQKRDWQGDRRLQPHERDFLAQLLVEPGVISQGEAVENQLNKSIWSETVSVAIEQIYRQMGQLGYFADSPRHYRSVIQGMAMTLFFISIIGLALTLRLIGDQSWLALPWVLTFLIAPFLTRLADLVPRRTPAGREQTVLWLGFRAMLARPTAIDSRFKADLYPKYLAYAIALRCERQWTARFGHLPCQLPDWFFSQTVRIDHYDELATALFGVIGYVGQKFSVSRKPTVG